jgi:sugar (pentulose or hexulose) kinase
MKNKYLGIELGSTRIKSVLTDDGANVIAQGSFEWENSLVDGLWTYSLEDVWKGLQVSYAELNKDYKAKFGEDITTLSAIGISAMMHGYLAFDKDDNLLVPFRTWRNTNTEQAARELTELFAFHIPERWSVAHYYQAMLNKEPHVDKVATLTTLAGYVHYKLTGRKVLGIGDASGMFPVKDKKYNKELLKKFNSLSGVDFESLLPQILLAGEHAGTLTQEGARLLDPTGKLKAGAIFCPPEGDAGTGMVATNSIAPNTANVSAGTSAFLMAVLNKDLKGYYQEIDMVTTPTGDPVAMVHVNNFTNEINAWAELFDEVVKLCGGTTSKGQLYEKLFKTSSDSDDDCGKLVGYNFLSGEPIAKVEQGRPLMVRQPDGKLNLANFMQMQIYSALATLAIGMEILQKEEVKLKSVCGHGGFFKTEIIGQRAMSAAVNAPVTVMQNAGEGGAWGIALLAQYALHNDISLQQFLSNIFQNSKQITVLADEKEKAKFALFLESYKKCLPVERLSSEVL